MTASPAMLASIPSSTAVRPYRWSSQPRSSLSRSRTASGPRSAQRAMYSCAHLVARLSAFRLARFSADPAPLPLGGAGGSGSDTSVRSPGECRVDPLAAYRRSASARAIRAPDWSPACVRTSASVAQASAWSSSRSVARSEGHRPLGLGGSALVVAGGGEQARPDGPPRDAGLEALSRRSGRVGGQRLGLVGATLVEQGTGQQGGGQGGVGAHAHVGQAGVGGAEVALGGRGVARQRLDQAGEELDLHQVAAQAEALDRPAAGPARRRARRTAWPPRPARAPPRPVGTRLPARRVPSPSPRPGPRTRRPRG